MKQQTGKSPIKKASTVRLRQGLNELDKAGFTSAPAPHSRRFCETVNGGHSWSAEGGTVVSGQGTAQVPVDWAAQGPHRIWLQEQSTTRDTVCFGTSAPLPVTVYQDRTSLGLQYVSVSLADSRKVEVHWARSGPGSLALPRGGKL